MNHSTFKQITDPEFDKLLNLVSEKKAWMKQPIDDPEIWFKNWKTRFFNLYNLNPAALYVVGEFDNDQNLKSFMVSYFSSLAPHWYLLHHVSRYDYFGINKSQYLQSAISLNKMVIDYAESRNCYNYFNAQNLKHSLILDKIYDRIGKELNDPKLFRYEKMVEYVYRAGDYAKFERDKFLCGDGPLAADTVINQFSLKKEHRNKIFGL